MKKRRHLSILIRSGIISIFSFLLTGILYFNNVFSFFEQKTYDQRMIFAADFIHPNDNIAFIEVDQESIDWAREHYGWSWPWPRESYARMIDFVSAGNANCIAFDLLFTEPSVYGEEDDIAFAEAEKRSGMTIQTSLITSKNTKNGIRTTVKEPVSVIKENAAILGNITSVMDDDDIIRRVKLEVENNGIIYPTLGTAPLYIQNRQEELKKIPRQKDGSVYLRFQHNMNAFIPYRASDILQDYEKWKAGEEGFYTPDEFSDSYVYVAYYAPGLFDFCSTPVSKVFPGVGIHITTLDNILTNGFIKKVPDVFVYVCLFGLSVIAALIVAFGETLSSQRKTALVLISGFSFGMVLTVGVPYILFANGIWFQLIPSVFIFIVAFIISIGVSSAVEGKQKRYIKSAFSQCLSKDVVNEIINDPKSFTLGGMDFEMTALFSDIRKFSSISEKLTAGELCSLLNFYLDRMSEIIIEEHGTIDKYVGDAIVAFVGAPVKMEDHAQRACRAAIRMKKMEYLLNEEIVHFVSHPKPEKMEDELYSAFQTLVKNDVKLFTRIGINSGEMVAGFFGTTNKKNYTMIGNNVNLASRLEGVNKQYRTNGILISENTRKQLGTEFVVRSLDRVRVVNVKTPLRLYELLDETNMANPELAEYVERWEEAFEEFEKGNYEKACNQMKKMYEEKSADKVCEYYINLMEEYFLKGKYPSKNDGAGVEYNPEDGVFTLLQK